MECCFIEITFNEKKYMIAGIYRIPNTDISSFIEKLNEILEPLKTSSELILLGDYNINLLNEDSNKNSFDLCLQSNYLIPTILAPTRIATKTLQNGLQFTTKTLIDNIIINNPTPGTCSGNPVTDIVLSISLSFAFYLPAKKLLNPARKKVRYFFSFSESELVK